VVAFGGPAELPQRRHGAEDFGQDIVIGIASRKSISAAITRVERDLTGTGAPVHATDNTVVAAVNQIHRRCDHRAASDIHLEPMRERLRIRFRQDGAMVPYKDISHDLATSLLTIR